MRLSHIVGGDVLARLGKATALAILDGLARREHHHDVLAGHDSKVKFGREFLHRLLAKHVGEVLALRKGQDVLAVGHGLENRDKLRRGNSVSNRARTKILKTRFTFTMFGSWQKETRII